MRHKFIISQDDSKKRLTISEYSVIEKDLNMVQNSFLRKEDFTLLCEETYDLSTIADSISEGVPALVSSLRTPNLFPIEPYATVIAESIINLYDSEDGDSTELFFDDRELVATAEDTLP